MKQFTLLAIIFAFCSFFAVQGQRLNPATLTPRLPEYYGQAYNVFYGNPLGPEIDPGFSARQVFAFNYSADQATSDGLFYYPKGVSTTTAVSCNYKSKSQEVIGMQSYHRSLEQKVSVGGGADIPFGSVSFTSSFEYRETQNTIKNQRNVNVLTVANCQLYEVTLQATQQLTQDFKDSVKRANQTGNWVEFIVDWGTHYGDKIVLGATAVQKKTFSQQVYQMLRAYKIDVSVAVNAKYMSAHGEASTSTGLSSTQQQYLNQIENTTVEYYIGQQPPQNGDARAWLSTVQQNAFPAPLSFTLRYIGNLFTAEYFKDAYSAEELVQMKKDFDATVKAIAETKPRVPTSDDPIPEAKLLEAETKVIGGGGGILYRDEPIRDFSVKVTGVRYQSGKFIDGLCLLFNNNEEGAWHGGKGGIISTMSFGENRVVKARVWISEAVVAGLLFVYETGGVSQMIGQSNGDVHEVPISGSLVGLKGRAGKYLDAIGFISNVVSLNPASPITTSVYSQYFGGNGGNNFDTMAGKDITTLSAKKLIIRSGSRIDALQLETSAGRSQLYGGRGGDEFTYTLANLKSIEVWADGVVNGIRINTSSGSSRIYGNQWGNYNLVEVPSGARLVGIYGRSGNIVDRVGFVFARTG